MVVKNQESNLKILTKAKKDLEITVDTLNHTLTSAEERSKCLSEKVSDIISFCVSNDVFKID